MTTTKSVSYKQLCVIAKAILLDDRSLDNFEWSERIKDQLVKARLGYPDRPDAIHAAMRAVEHSLQKTMGPRPVRAQPEPEPLLDERTPDATGLAMDDFETFWACYPKKVSKADTMKAYAKAVTQASPGAILRGLEAYALSKPESEEWCDPATFLKQGRFLNKPGRAWVHPRAFHCPHTPPCHSRFWCESGARDERDRMRR